MGGWPCSRLSYPSATHRCLCSGVCKQTSGFVANQPPWERQTGRQEGADAEGGIRGLDTLLRDWMERVRGETEMFG